MQIMKEGANRDAFSARLITDLIRIHNQFLQKVSELDEIIKKKVGPKGDDGYTPKKYVDYFTKEEVGHMISQTVNQVLTLVRVPKDGEDAKPPTKAELLELITPLIPKIKNGETPKKGIHYFTNDDIDKIVKLTKASIGKQNVEIDPEEFLKIFTKKGKKLSVDFIDGLEQTMSARFHQLARGYLHGGGDTVVAGSNVTITSNANGTKTIASTGGSGSGVSVAELGVDSDNPGIYTVPANTAFIALIGSNAPFVYASNQYSGSGTTTLTLDTTKVNAPAVGTLILLYTP